MLREAVLRPELVRCLYFFALNVEVRKHFRNLKSIIEHFALHYDPKMLDEIGD